MVADPNEASAVAPVCPVTGLPIHAPAAWARRGAGDGYAIGFRMIGRRILHSLPYGDLKQADLDQAYALRAGFLREFFGGEPRPVVEIRDYRDTHGTPTRIGRVKQKEYLLGLRGQVIAFLVCEASWLVRGVWRAGLRLTTPPFPVFVVKDFARAATQAASLAARHESDGGPGPQADESGDRDEVGELLRFISLLAWDEPAATAPPSVVAGPFAPVYEALALLRDDVGDYRREAEAHRLRIEQQNQALRAEVARREQAEAVLTRALSAAEAAARAKGEFLANISHEMRTPLNGILGLCDLLLGPGLDPERRSLIESLRGSGEALRCAVDDILDLSRLEAGGLRLAPEPCDLEPLLAETVGSVVATVRSKSLDLAVAVEAGVPLRVVADAPRLRQALLNLLGNAVKFTEAGGVFVRVRQRPGDGPIPLIEFTVADTGIGIPAEAQERIFEPFTQADASTTRRFGGSGLGLAICRRLVGLMGGSVEVRSQPGRGSSFSFTIPLPSAEDQAPEPVLRGREVLVADPWWGRRQMAVAAVSRLGGQAIEASCDQAADWFAAGRRFDLAIVGPCSATLGRRPPADQKTLRMALVPGDGDDLPHLPIPLSTAALIAAIRACEQTPIAVPAASPPFAGLPVLLVEDHPVNQRVAELLLARLGCTVTVAGDAAAGLSILATNRQPLVFMDVHMPGMDGCAATRAIRNDPALAATRVVGLSASAMPEDRERCRSAGMNDFVAKPVRLSEIEAAIRRNRPA